MDIKRFILADKPTWVKPVDVAVIVYFSVICDAEGRCTPTYEEISDAIGGGDTGYKAIRSSIDRLRVNQWIWRDKHGVGERTHYTVLFKNLPGKEEHGPEAT